MKKTKPLEIELLEFADFANPTWDNKLNLSGIFDEIYVNKIPAIHPRMYAVGIGRGTPGRDYGADILIKDPKGKTLQAVELKLTPGGNGRANFIAEVEDLPLKTTGRYTLHILSNKKVVGKRNLEVKKEN